MVLKPSSDQLEALQAGVTFAADDDVVMDGDPKRLGDVDDVAGHRVNYQSIQILRCKLG